MTKDKQIEEIQSEIIRWGENADKTGNYNYPLSAHLYTAGYRKAEDVAFEVINKALSNIQIMISSIKAQEKNGIITEFNGGAKTALEIVFKDLAELKKKYTEDCDG